MAEPDPNDGKCISCNGFGYFTAEPAFIYGGGKIVCQECGGSGRLTHPVKCDRCGSVKVPVPEPRSNVQGAKYLVFSGDDYYPSGGAYDFHSAHDTLESALAVDPKAVGEWAHIAELDSGQGLVIRYRNYHQTDWKQANPTKEWVRVE